MELTSSWHCNPINQLHHLTRSACSHLLCKQEKNENNTHLPCLCLHKMKSWAGVSSGWATPGCLKEDHACIIKCSRSFFSSQLTRRFQCLDFRRRIVYQSDSEQLFKHTHSVSHHRLQKINHFVYFCIGSLSKSMQFIHMTVYINIYVIFVSHQQCVFITE